METEYIEKQAAISLPVLPKEHREYQTMNLDDAYENGWYDALECVEKLPPADVRPVVRGRWIEDGLDWLECSSCGAIWWRPMFTKTRWSYCPNCGAKMEGNE